MQWCYTDLIFNCCFHTVQNTFQKLSSIYSALQLHRPSQSWWQGWWRTCGARTLVRHMSPRPRECEWQHRAQRATGSYSLIVHPSFESYQCSFAVSQLLKLHPCYEASSMLGQSVAPICFQVLLRFVSH